MKFALISNVLPPSGTAHAAIIYRLLRDLDPSTYCLLSSQDYSRPRSADYSGRLAGKYYYLQPLLKLFGKNDVPLPRSMKRITVGLRVLRRARAIARILKLEKCDAIVVCTGGNEIVDFPAAYLASRLVGVHFYAYLLDQYSHMVSYVLGGSFLRTFERRIMKNSTAVIAPNEFLRDELRRRYQIEAVVIHNACDLSAYDSAPRDQSEAEVVRDEVRIVYTGGVGPLHYDALRNLVTALDLRAGENGNVRGKRAKLHIYTAQPAEMCKREGIVGPVEYHPHEHLSAMPAIQREADVLFLPLAFESPYPEIIKTAAPGKIGELLAAGRPILVHAPADSFVAWYFRHYDCGLVVDENDSTKLAAALTLVLTDALLRERLIKNARNRAEADFSVEKAKAQFADVLGLTKNQHNEQEPNRL